MRQLIFALLFFGFGSPAFAECMELRDFIKQETAGPDKYVDTLGFRREHHTDSILMLVKTTIEKGRLPQRWLFLHRDNPDARDYCMVSRGVTFGQHQDMTENASAGNFGPPGSGLPHCAKDGKDFTAQEQLRYWANRDLGPSNILYVATPDGPGFQFLFTNDQDWIIIEDEKDQSCYYDRGPDMSLKFNTKLINP
jgi:hypothetical protein